MRSVLYGAGMSNVLDTYLSPLEYKGPEIRILRENMRMTRLMNGNVSAQNLLQANVSYTHNPSQTANMYAGLINWTYALHYQFRLNEQLKLLAGPMIDLNGGFVYNTRNSNNPAQAKAYGSVGISGMAIQIARETDLPELLSHLGYQVKRVGRFHTTAEMDSLRIKDRRKWFRYSQNTGGDAITFLQQFCGKSFPEAVEYLLTFHGKARDAPIPQPKPISPKQEFSLPPRNADDRRVFAYLRKRGIAAQVIRQFLNAGLLYEDAVHHNCVFVGRDESGQAKYAGLRGTYDLDSPGFKGDATGSDKNTGFSLPHDPQSDLVLVFEAPIDLMSYLTLHRDMVNAVALCGLYDGALQTYLQAHPEIRRIALCLDADEPGQKAAQQLQEKYQLQGYAVLLCLR